LRVRRHRLDVGLLHRIAALREFIDYVKRQPGVREQMARRYLGEAARHMKRRRRWLRPRPC
jgi:hypothetical protein